MKKFSDIKLEVWWQENQVNFVFTMVIAIGFTVASYYSNTLTVERCFYAGFFSDLISEKILNWKYK